MWPVELITWWAWSSLLPRDAAACQHHAWVMQGLGDELIGKENSFYETKWLWAETAMAVSGCVVIPASLKCSGLAAGRKHIPQGAWKCKECSGCFREAEAQPQTGEPLCAWRWRASPWGRLAWDEIYSTGHWYMDISCHQLWSVTWAEPNYFSRDKLGFFYNYDVEERSC